MLSVSKAQKKILRCRIKIKTVSVPILESLGSVLAENVTSKDDIPIYDNSAMDGYSVRVEDIKGAGKNNPVRLMLSGSDLPAGRLPTEKLKSGYCMSIMTGAPIPAGSNTVVMKEDTKKDGKNILFFKQYTKGENIRGRGEDIKKGDKVLKKGIRISPADVGVMASLGKSKVIVGKSPLVGIISTGDELLRIDEELKAGRVRDSNSYALSAQLTEIGVNFIRYGITGDKKEVLTRMIRKALEECDVLLISGGVSVGDYDFVKEILSDIGAKTVFWRVNQKPGKPLVFSTYHDKFIFGLPGNPVSVMICFEMYVRPLVMRMMGNTDLFRPTVIAKASHDFKKARGRTNFARVILIKKGSKYFFKSTGMQGSGILTSMAKADGIAVFPEESGDIRKGREVKIFCLKV